MMDNNNRYNLGSFTHRFNSNQIIHSREILKVALLAIRAIVLIVKCKVNLELVKEWLGLTKESHLILMIALTSYKWVVHLTKARLQVLPVELIHQKVGKAN